MVSREMKTCLGFPLDLSSSFAHMPLSVLLYFLFVYCGFCFHVEAPLRLAGNYAFSAAAFGLPYITVAPARGCLIPADPPHGCTTYAVFSYKFKPLRVHLKSAVILFVFIVHVVLTQLADSNRFVGGGVGGRKNKWSCQRTNGEIPEKKVGS